MRKIATIWMSFCITAGLATAQNPTVIATGLQAPQRLLKTADGNFLVTETNVAVNSGRLSLVSRSGQRRSLIEGLPSGTAAPGDGSGPTGLALSGNTLYLAQGVGDSERNGTRPGTSVLNPDGTSSPLQSSVLSITFSGKPDTIQGPLKLTPQHQQQLADGYEVVLEDGLGGSATVSLLANFPDVVPDANTIYRGSNPFSLELSPDGASLYVADASLNAIQVINTRTGRVKKIASFPPFSNPTPVGPPVIDPVPTSVRLYQGRLIVSMLSGFPFVPGLTRVVNIGLDGGPATLDIAGLSSAVDVLIKDVTGAPSQWFVLEHSANMLATPREPGRLVMYDSPERKVITESLDGPVSMVLSDDGRSMYVLELSGRIVEVKLP